jgi:hypothetical protein
MGYVDRIDLEMQEDDGSIDGPGRGFEGLHFASWSPGAVVCARPASSAPTLSSRERQQQRPPSGVDDESRVNR